MPLPVITDHFFVQATFQHLYQEISVNTFCFRNDGPTDNLPEFAVTVAALLDTFYGDRGTDATTVGNALSSNLFGLRYVVYDLGAPDGGAFEVASATWPETGSEGGSDAPPDLAIVMSWQTGLRGRSFRGRTFIGPLSASVVDGNGRVVGTTRDRLAAAGSKLIGVPLTRDAQISVLSRTKGVATPITGGYVDDAFDVQRRRDPGPTTRTPIVAP